MRISLLLLVMAVSAPAFAQDKTLGPLEVEMGANTFRTHCAPCHGRSATGDGPMADSLRFAPADLTRLAVHNHGQFPFDAVFKIVEGRERVKGHGTPDMPVWGDVFLDAREGYSQEKVRERITQVVRYLETIQRKK
jgi:mono/diheme cytochrome c family protein